MMPKNVYKPENVYDVENYTGKYIMAPSEPKNYIIAEK